MAPTTQSVSAVIADAPSTTDDRRTATQFAILEVLAEAGEPLALGEIHDRLVLRTDLAYEVSEWNDETKERYTIQQCLYDLHNSEHIDCNGRGTPWRLTPKGRTAIDAFRMLLE